VAVGLGVRDVLGRDVAGAAGLVLDDDALTPGFRELRRQDARRRVDAAARRDRADDAHRLGRPAFGTGGARPGDRGAGQRQDVTPPQSTILHRPTLFAG
jgi:hypothetical protein